MPGTCRRCRNDTRVIRFCQSRLEGNELAMSVTGGAVHRRLRRYPNRPIGRGKISPISRAFSLPGSFSAFFAFFPGSNFAQHSYFCLLWRCRLTAGGSPARAERASGAAGVGRLFRLQLCAFLDSRFGMLFGGGTGKVISEDTQLSCDFVARHQFTVSGR